MPLEQEGKPKIARKTFYYVSIHAKHVEKGGCGDEKVFFSMAFWQ